VLVPCMLRTVRNNLQITPKRLVSDPNSELHEIFSFILYSNPIQIAQKPLFRARTLAYTYEQHTLSHAWSYKRVYARKTIIKYIQRVVNPFTATFTPPHKLLKNSNAARVHARRRPHTHEHHASRDTRVRA
jgi:hypothetical protein